MVAKVNPVKGTEGCSGADGLGTSIVGPVSVGVVLNAGTQVKVIIRLDNGFR